MAPPISAITVDIFTGVRVSLAIQMVDLSGPPSAEDSSTLNASNVPAGTVTLSDPATWSCISFTFCFCTSKLRKAVRVALGQRKTSDHEIGAGAVGEERAIQIHGNRLILAVISIVPAALPFENSRSIATVPASHDASSVRLPLSSVVVSSMSPIGVSMLSIALSMRRRHPAMVVEILSAIC